MENVTDNKEIAVPTSAPVAVAPQTQMKDAPRGGAGRSFGGGAGGKDFKKNPRKGGPSREPRAKPEFDQKIINIRRVTRVASGGRRFSFSVALVAGNRKGSVGVGLGKAGDTSIAINKALKSAKKNMVKINTTKDMSIPHEVEHKFSSARIRIYPAKGRGVVAGSAVRTVIELAGLKDIGAKIFSPSKNKLNIARCAISALSKIEPVKEKTSTKAKEAGVIVS